MCLLAIYYRTLSNAPVLVAANREEFYQRPTARPELIEGQTGRILCGRDLQAGGTWLGVNAWGVVVAVTNRRKAIVPAAPRSRGRLCLDLLAARNADEASRQALDELATGHYAGANYVCLDDETAAVIHGGDRLERLPLEPGEHLLTNGDIDDPLDVRIDLARRLFAAYPFQDAAGFITAAQAVCRYTPAASEPHSGPTIVLRGPDRGTVSSTLIALSSERSGSIYQHADGPPDRTAYDDLSPFMRAMFGS